MNNILLTEIRGHIRQMTGAEMNEIIGMIRDRRKVVSREAQRNLWGNQPVSFNNKGHQFFGRIIKVNRKNCRVLAIREDQVGRDDSYTPVRPSEWTVPNTMLEHAPEFSEFDSAGVRPTMGSRTVSRCPTTK
jgi:hypothetical protein